MRLRARHIDFGKGLRLGVAFPWGDVSTAYTTTGIPSITVYGSVPPSFRWIMLAGNLLAPLFHIPAIRERAKTKAGTAVGLDSTARQNTPTYVWGGGS